MNNLLLLGFAFAVFLGTLFPLLSEAVRGVKVSVGEPFFNKVNVPIGLVLIFLMGVGPFIAWRRASFESLRRNLSVPLLAAFLGTGVCSFLGVRGLYPLLAFALAALVATAIVQEFARGVRTRRQIAGESYVAALAALTRRSRRRYGGLIVHLGVALVVVGVTASSVFKQEKEVTLGQGESVHLGRYRVRFDELEGWQEAHRFVVQGTFTVFDADRRVAEMRPAKRFYPSEQQPIGTVDVRSTPREDLYVVLSAFARDGRAATLKVIVRPLVMWIWIGGAVMALGALVAIWPDRRLVVPEPAKERVTAWQAGRS
jgi:cytochrome c-type biogenesis protein CcmF